MPTLPLSHKPTPYRGLIVVNFEEDMVTGRLESIKIKTDHLELRPPKPEDIDAYDAIFGNAENMALYLGCTRTREQTVQRLKMYVDMWSGRGKYGGIPYPYSGFAIVYKGQVIGNIVLGNGEEKGEAQIGLALNRDFHHMGIGKESVTAIVKGLAPELFKRGYQVNLHETNASGECIAGQLEYIKATASPKNTYSLHLLEDAGFLRHGYDEKTDRLDYRMTMKKLLTS
ncbi:MAG: GNAT family N-acetyltransferase [Verrucomicrobia bacterium]|nr:GNAT family N-acetyltransferase [Verrucomicrobiota bacterium]